MAARVDDPGSTNQDLKLLTLPEVAEFLRCSRAAAYRLADSGELRAVHIGPKLVRVKSSDLAAYIDRQPGEKRA